MKHLNQENILQFRTVTAIDSKPMLMKYCFIPLFCMMLAASSVQAQTDADMLQPVQQILVDNQEKTIVPPEAYSLKVAEGSCGHAVEALQQILPGCQAKSRFQIILGKKGDKSVKKYVPKIPKEKEGYYTERPHRHCRCRPARHVLRSADIGTDAETGLSEHLLHTGLSRHKVPRRG